MVLDGRLHDCKLAIHAECFDELTKIDDSIRTVQNRRIESISKGTIMILQDEQKMCCHHCLNTQMVNGGSLKSIASIKVYITILQDVLSVLSPFSTDFSNEDKLRFFIETL